jgi:hypothetical protein
MASDKAKTNEDVSGNPDTEERRAYECARRSDEEMAETMVGFFEEFGDTRMPEKLRVSLRIVFCTMVRDIRAGERLRLVGTSQGGATS